MASQSEPGGSTPPMLPRAIIDASVLIPAAISARGTSRDLLNAGSRGLIVLLVSQDVLNEVERNLYRKAPRAVRAFWEQRDHLVLVELMDEQVAEVARFIEPKDAHVVAGAILARADFLVSFDRRHLLGEADLIRRTYGIEVVTPDFVTALLGIGGGGR